MLCPVGATQVLLVPNPLTACTKIGFDSPSSLLCSTTKDETSYFQARVTNPLPDNLDNLTVLLKSFVSFTEHKIPIKNLLPSDKSNNYQ